MTMDSSLTTQNHIIHVHQNSKIIAHDIMDPNAQPFELVDILFTIKYIQYFDDHIYFIQNDIVNDIDSIKRYSIINNQIDDSWAYTHSDNPLSLFILNSYMYIASANTSNAFKLYKIDISDNTINQETELLSSVSSNTQHELLIMDKEDIILFTVGPELHKYQNGVSSLLFTTPNTQNIVSVKSYHSDLIHICTTSHLYNYQRNSNTTRNIAWSNTGSMTLHNNHLYTASLPNSYITLCGHLRCVSDVTLNMTSNETYTHTPLVLFSDGDYALSMNNKETGCTLDSQTKSIKIIQPTHNKTVELYISDLTHTVLQKLHIRVILL